MSKEKEYYVYNVYYRGILVYIGKGKGRRWKHIAYGRSANELINDFFFRNKYLGDMNLDVRISGWFKTDAQAKKEEKKQIDKFKPYCNKVAGREHENNYSFKDKLVDISLKKCADEVEELWSKFDFRMLFTPKGLLCKKTYISKNSVFEKAEEDYHIRIKDKYYKYFPEYLLCFLNFDTEADAEFWAFFGVRNTYIQMLEIGACEITDYGDLDWHIKALDSEHFKYIKNNDRQLDIDLYTSNRTKTDTI